MASNAAREKSFQGAGCSTSGRRLELIAGCCCRASTVAKSDFCLLLGLKSYHQNGLDTEQFVFSSVTLFSFDTPFTRFLGLDASMLGVFPEGLPSRGWKWTPRSLSSGTTRPLRTPGTHVKSVRKFDSSPRPEDAFVETGASFRWDFQTWESRKCTPGTRKSDWKFFHCCPRIYRHVICAISIPTCHNYED